MSDLICPELHPDHYVNKRCELDLDHPGMHRAGVLRWGNYTGSYSAPWDNSPACQHGARVHAQGEGRAGKWAAWFCPITYSKAEELGIDPCSPLPADWKEEADEPAVISFEDHMKQVEEKHGPFDDEPTVPTPECIHGQMKYLAGSNAKASWEMFVCPLPLGEEGQCRKTLSVPEGWVRPDGTVKEFFVEDEPVEEVRAAFDASTEGGVTAPPVDMVNHPPHYKGHPSGIECIEITEHMGFCLGNAVKYIWRADLKNDAIEDLEKAAFYLDREIKLRKKQLAGS